MPTPGERTKMMWEILLIAALVLVAVMLTAAFLTA
jgi:predicted small secreted protein